ncbi:MAG TPA: YegP family protein [Phnomibacter sp.]|nr:YegP family protein [Phnomibacter sp.]
MAKFIVSTRSNGEYQFKLVAGNGQTILVSEGYNAKASCLSGIESVKKNAGDDNRYELLTSSNGKPYFNLKASNGQVIGTSQMYASEETRATGIAAVKEGAPDAEVVEENA